MSMSHRVAAKKLGSHVPGGMCELHTFRAAVYARGEALPSSAAPDHEYVSATPYQEWVADVLASGVLRMDGMQIVDVRRPDLSRLTGLNVDTLTKLAHGKTKFCRPKVSQALSPFLHFVETSPAYTPLEVGQSVTSATQLAYAPGLAVVVDRYGRAWQKRRAGWVPAHTPGKVPRFKGETTPSIVLPARVVYLHAVLVERPSH